MSAGTTPISSQASSENAALCTVSRPGGACNVDCNGVNCRLTDCELDCDGSEICENSSVDAEQGCQTAPT